MSPARLCGQTVIASEAKRSSFGNRGCGFVWIASLSLAMTNEIARS